MRRFTKTTSLADAADCDLIVEVGRWIYPQKIDYLAQNETHFLLLFHEQAIAENMDLKLNFYKNLGPIIKPDCIFASNTSSLQITAMGLASGRPQNFVGLHFFNPVQLMRLVEVSGLSHACAYIQRYKNLKHR